jgi:hypothetical protein
MEEKRTSGSYTVRTPRPLNLLLGVGSLVAGGYLGYMHAQGQNTGAEEAAVLSDQVRYALMYGPTIVRAGVGAIKGGIVGLIGGGAVGGAAGASIDDKLSHAIVGGSVGAVSGAAIGAGVGGVVGGVKGGLQTLVGYGLGYLVGTIAK